WESDEEKSGADSEAEAASSSSDEEEEKKEAAPAEEEAGWTTNLHAIDVPLPRLRHQQQRLPPDCTPFQLLQCFLTSSLMREFAQHTNAAAPHGWRPTTAAELYAFLGAHLFMGIDRLPRTEMYWNSTFSHPLLTSLFSRDRFKQLLRFFRVAALDADAAPRDPLPHIHSLAAKLNAAFEAHFIPTQELTLDEAMAAFKGRSPIKQYIPSKPHKWGYKIYCMSSEDYLLRFEIYVGAEERSAEGATFDTVMRMTRGYEEKGHVLYMDNWFTSPAVLDALQQKGIRCCGSVRRNRRGMPVIPDAEMHALGRGQWIQRQKDDTTLAVWKDQKVVWVLYNHCSPGETASLDRWSEAGNKISIGCPKAIRDYFYGARSVDVLSQLHYAYAPGRKAMRSWPRLAWWLLDMCIVNAFKLWSIGQEHPSQLDFRMELMHELLQQLPANDHPRKHGGHPHAPCDSVKEHFAEAAGGEGDCAHCSHQPEHRVRSSFICHACGAHLCLGECFALYHS
ncbi:MAG: transposase, partial [Candidatus Pacebacteria bacterium]|nr:transposase [Candidatus Paceibacterota bacterium]